MHTYVLIMAMALLGLFAHLGFSVFYLAAQCTPMALVHIAGAALFLVTNHCMRKGAFDMAGILLCLMMAVSSIATVLYIGGESYAINYLFLMLASLMVIPFKKRWLPPVICLIALVLMLILHHIDLRYPPMYDLGGMALGLSYANLMVVFFGLLVLLSLHRIVESFLDSFVGQRMAELESQAYLDPLTHLYNRRYAEMMFELMRSSNAGQSSCVAIADIDDFKVVNDTWGHDAGDKVLRQLSEIFERNIRKTDMAVRWGGEEFLLILQGADLESARKALDKIRRVVEETEFSLADATLHLTITIGVAELNARDINDGIHECDKRLYEGKKAGKNRVV